MALLQPYKEGRPALCWLPPHKPGRVQWPGQGHTWEQSWARVCTTRCEHMERNQLTPPTWGWGVGARLRAAKLMLLKQHHLGSIKMINIGSQPMGQLHGMNSRGNTLKSRPTPGLDSHLHLKDEECSWAQHRPGPTPKPRHLGLQNWRCYTTWLPLMFFLSDYQNIPSNTTSKKEYRIAHLLDYFLLNNWMPRCYR